MLSITVAVALAIIKNAEKQRIALAHQKRAELYEFFDALSARDNFYLMQNAQLYVRGCYDNQQHRLFKLAQYGGNSCAVAGLLKVMRQFKNVSDRPRDDSLEAYVEYSTPNKSQIFFGPSFARSANQATPRNKWRAPHAAASPLKTIPLKRSSTRHDASTPI